MMQILQVKYQGETSSAPNFRKVNIGSCYHCALLIPDDKSQWICNKYKIVFGDLDTEDGVANQSEFICDDFEEM